MIRLRGHHLLCLLGYRGMGYSPDFCTNMTAIYERLREQPQTRVVLVEGPDDICAAYPKDKPPHCEETSVAHRDSRVLEKLGLRVGREMSWADVCGAVDETMEAGDIGRICVGCPWEPYGVCEDGVQRIKRGEELPPVGA